jgi:hypothetical protein
VVAEIRLVVEQDHDAGQRVGPWHSHAWIGGTVFGQVRQLLDDHSANAFPVAENYDIRYQAVAHSDCRCNIGPWRQMKSAEQRISSFQMIDAALLNACAGHGLEFFALQQLGLGRFSGRNRIDCGQVMPRNLRRTDNCPAYSNRGQHQPKAGANQDGFLHSGSQQKNQSRKAAIW